MPFVWPPLKHLVRLVVVLPSSNLSILPGLREKTEFAGEVARALAIYKVSDVIIYDDEFSEPGDSDLLATILNYLQVPPYLRKRLIPITPELRFVGLLHPLNIATHNPEGVGPRPGDLRDGLVVTSWGLTAKTYIGFKSLCFTESNKELSPNERVLVRIIRSKPLKCRVEDPDEIPEYVGYRVHKVGGELLKVLKSFKGAVILTSKVGEDFSINSNTVKSIISESVRKGSLIILFGNSRLDFDEIVGSKVINSLGNVYRVNFIPGQGVLSVRTVEAIHAVLSQLNLILHHFSRRHLRR